MELTLYQIDAFAGEMFKGNPAAVIPLEEWLPDELMQSIAEENNLSETAFFVPQKEGYHIRWFTPVAEVDLCGHATLASGYVLFNILGIRDHLISFQSKSGILKVAYDGEFLIMDFPAQVPKLCDPPEELLNAFDKTPLEVLKAEDYLVLFEDEKTIAELKPDFDALKKLDLRGVIVTAKGNDVDFVSRFFAPAYAIDEDPVTGSAHTELTPYWAEKLGKKKLTAKQISKRGGELSCELKGNRVEIVGKAVKYMEGKIIL